MQTILPCLWFDTDTEEAVAFYTSTFHRADVGATLRYDGSSAREASKSVGSVLCPTEGCVDTLWNALAESGMALMPLDAHPIPLPRRF